MTTPLLEEVIERDLQEIRDELQKMARLVVRALKDAVQALQSRDRRLAYSVILGDNRIDVLEGHVDRLCQEFLIRHMPVAGQLRFVIAATKVNSELERMGDYADAIARRTVGLVNVPELPTTERLFEMAQVAIAMVEEATAAFIDEDPERAQKALDREAAVDALNHDLFHELAHPDRGESDLTTRFALLGVLNRFERVADRACNVAEDAIYAVRGEVVRHRPRTEQRVLLLSKQDSTLGPMAEAMAQKRAPLMYSFTSAGLEPGDIDTRMVAFMAKRGIEVARNRSRSLEEVGKLDDFQVVVLLSKQAEDACPQLPYKTVALTWELPDPSIVDGTPAEVDAAYSRAFTEIDTKLGDLLHALLGDNPAASSAHTRSRT
jgi:phosphate transport system protein